MTRYRWAADRKDEGFLITMACEVAEVSRQAFYDWQLRTESGPSEAEQAEEVLVEQMLGIHDEFDETYGSPRMTIELADQGTVVDHKRIELVSDAVKVVAGVRGGATAGINFHSDRESQYMSGDLRYLVADLEMVYSVGRTGQCWDNSVAESFFNSLKRELVSRHRFQDRTGACRAIFTWINRCNTRWLHSSLEYRPPIEWENTYQQHTVDQVA